MTLHKKIATNEIVLTVLDIKESYVMIIYDMLLWCEYNVIQHISLGKCHQLVPLLSKSALPRHVCELQVCHLDELPWQPLSPRPSVKQNLILICLPPPHVTLQLSHGPHPVHLPSTDTSKGRYISEPVNDTLQSFKRYRQNAN